MITSWKRTNLTHPVHVSIQAFVTSLYVKRDSWKRKLTHADQWSVSQIFHIFHQPHITFVQSNSCCMKLWNVAITSFNKFVSQNGDYSGDLIFISLWSEKRPITLACIIFAEWNPILVSYSFWGADSKHSACFDWMSHFLTKCDALYSIFAFDHNLQGEEVMFYSLTSRKTHMIPVFLSQITTVSSILSSFSLAWMILKTLFNA